MPKSLRLTCTKCLNSFDEDKDYSMGKDCPLCLQHKTMKGFAIGKNLDLIGKLILGVPVFENSSWAESILCGIEDRHDPHTWEQDEQRFVCRGRQLERKERVIRVLLTQKENRLVQIAGISRELEPIQQTFEVWHSLPRTIYLLTLTDPEEGLPGVKLEQIVPKHTFTPVAMASDSQHKKEKWSTLLDLEDLDD